MSVIRVISVIKPDIPDTPSEKILISVFQSSRSCPIRSQSPQYLIKTNAVCNKFANHYGGVEESRLLVLMKWYQKISTWKRELNPGIDHTECVLVKNQHSPRMVSHIFLSNGFPSNCTHILQYDIVNSGNSIDNTVPKERGREGREAQSLQTFFDCIEVL